MSISDLRVLAAMTAGLAIATAPAAFAFQETGDPVIEEVVPEEEIIIDDGLVFEGTAECTDPESALNVFKDVTVCFDPKVGYASAAWMYPPDLEACDPFPDDGMFTYVYQLRNDPASSLSTLGLEVTVLVEPGAIADAGVLMSDGVAPTFTLVEADRVTWFFAGSPIMPGEMSKELYIVSPLGPEERPFAVLGEFGVDCTATCVGPGVVCAICEDDGRGGGGDDDDDDGDDGDGDDGDDEPGGGGPDQPTNTVFSCPSGPAADDGQVASDESMISTGTLTVTKTVEVCGDPPCGLFGCDPFPDDNKLTYMYVVTVEPGSSTPMKEFRIEVADYSVIDAGYLAGDGVVPTTVIVKRNKVKWKFDDDLVQSGETTATLYLRSSRQPGVQDARIKGADKKHEEGDCIGPVDAP